MKQIYIHVPTSISRLPSPRAGKSLSHSRTEKAPIVMAQGRTIGAFMGFRKNQRPIL